MGIAEYIVILILVAECIITGQIISNLHYARKESRIKEHIFRPRCVLIVPCKGLDEAFDKNIESFYLQDYRSYHLWFVVQDRQDPAFERLNILQSQLSGCCRAQSVKILISGPTVSASQKLHNLLYAYRQIPDDTEILAFADSDACVGNKWLQDLIHPLYKPKNGASSGYRCFIPKTKNLATVVLSALNIKICQFLGGSRFNLAWGGSMAISVKDFRDFGIDKLWAKSLSDDLSLSTAVRKHHKKVVFAPGCMTASIISTSWEDLWEFARRQFIITRIYTPLMWWFALINSFISSFGAVGALCIGLVLNHSTNPNAPVYFWAAGLLLAFKVSRMITRQRLIQKLLPHYQSQLKLVKRMDICLFWPMSVLFFLIVLSSALGRTITWRGIRYRLNSPMDISVLDRS